MKHLQTNIKFCVAVIVITLVIITIIPPAVIAKNNNEIEKIKKLHTETSQFVKNKKAKQSCYQQRFSSDNSGKSNWIKGCKKTQEHNVFSWVNVYKKKDILILAQFEHTSPTGDWFLYADYYYRNNGTAAFVYARLNTFHGGGRSIVRRYYYDDKGVSIKVLEEIYDLSDKSKLLEPSKEINLAKDEDSILYPPFDLIKFIKVSELPFDSTISAQQSKPPKFSDFSVDKIYDGKNASIDFSSHSEALMYKTRLLEAAKKRVNFAGKYIFTSWGCGTTCRIAAIIDAISGKVFILPFSVCCWEIDKEKPFTYKIDSKLLIIKGMKNEEDPGGTFYYKWENNKLTLVKWIKK